MFYALIFSIESSCVGRSGGIVEKWIGINFNDYLAIKKMSLKEQLSMLV